MARRFRSHTKRRKHRGGDLKDYLPSWLGGTPASPAPTSASSAQTPGEQLFPPASPVLNGASRRTSPVVPPGVAPEAPGVNTLGGRRRRSRKTRRRRRGGKYY